jgi:methionyl-tRNA formyltransferase
MKITVFTSNQNRHNYLINSLSKICEELFVIQESKTIFPGIISGHYSANNNMKKYFQNVVAAELNLFGNSFVNKYNRNIKILPLQFGDLNKCSMGLLKDFIKSDYYIVFGSSYIKGELVDFLVDNKAINIHMGVSPYYRGTDCNFWALYDNNPHLVGATIHLLSKGIDSGPILYHAMSKVTTNSFEYTMSTVKSAFDSLAEKIEDSSILNIKTELQNNSKEIRYSKKDEFNENVVKEFFKKKIKLDIKMFNNSLLQKPFFLKN